MERSAHRLGARHARLHSAMYALVVITLALAGALAPQMTPIAHAAYAVTGTVYRDYNANGARDAREPGVGGVAVIAYDDSGAALATTTISAVPATLGQYTLNIPNDNPVRIEFGGLPSGFLSGPHGGQSDTSVAFAGGPAAIDFAINRPSQYCQSNPTLVTNCYVRGYQLSQSNPVVVSFPYSSGGTTPADFDNPNTHAMMITSDQVGTTWGLAYQRASNSLFAAAFMKRHTGFGPNGPGAIYRIDPTANTAGLFLDLDALLGAGTTGGDPHPPGVTPDYIADGWYRDANAWDPVGKRLLGDLDPSVAEPAPAVRVQARVPATASITIRRITTGTTRYRWRAWYRFPASRMWPKPRSTR